MPKLGTVAPTQFSAFPCGVDSVLTRQFALIFDSDGFRWLTAGVNFKEL